MELLQLSDQLNHHSKMQSLGIATQQDLEQLCRDTPAHVSAVQNEQLGGGCQLETVLHQEHLLVNHQELINDQPQKTLGYCLPNFSTYP